MDSTKKISFGFTKLTKKSNLVINKPPENKPENEIQLIQCLEENSIKLIHEEKPEAPLVIPAQKNRTSAALASLKLREAILSGNLDENDIDDNEINFQNQLKSKTNIDSKAENEVDESLEKKAARELLEEINNKSNKNDDDNINKFNVPLKPDELILDGAEEPKLDDYEKIPISKFGVAMLRGMGWNDEENKKKNKTIDDQPFVRPKGMGLGADKVIKQKPLLVAPEKNEKLIIKKNAYVRILGGKYKDLYAQIEGLDDHAGRVIVKLALGGNKESLNEFLVQPVSKGEYTKYAKVINSAKYEEYTKFQDEKGISTKIKQERDEMKIKGEPIDNKNIKKEIKQEKYDKYEYKPSGSASSRSSSKKCDLEEKSKSLKDYERYHYREQEQYRKNDHHQYHRREEKNQKQNSRYRRDSSCSTNSSDYHSKRKSKSDKKHKSRDKKKTKKSKRNRSRSRSRER